MNAKLTSLSVGIVVLALTGVPASASVTEYTDVAAFDAATSPASFNFEGIAPSGSYVFGDVAVGGVTFTTNGGQDFVIAADAGIGGYGASFFSGQSLYPGTDPSQVICTLSGAGALGFTYGAFIDSGLPFTVSLSTGDSFSLTTPVFAGADTGFVGFVSSTPITSVTFSDNGVSFDLINFSSAAPVPEPGTSALLGTGLLFVLLLAQRRTLIRGLRRADVRG